MDHQIIYPAIRLLRNPKIFIAIATTFDGPEWQVLADAFYDLIESEFEEADDIPVFDEEVEVCFRQDPEEEDVFQGGCELIGLFNKATNPQLIQSSVTQLLKV